MIDEYLNTMTTLKKKFEAFQTKGGEGSGQFVFWNSFIQIIYPALRDLTRSHRKGDMTNASFCYP